MQKELAEAGEASSAVRQRRAYKNIVRDGEDLLEGSPAAPNRWRVLAIMFEGQKQLLGLDNSTANREALLETCERLAEAPDELADLRLEADMLLSEQELSGRNADVTERAEALAQLIARYRDTPGEAKCLMMAALIAPKLEAFELGEEIDRTLGERFAGDLDVIEWRRKHRDFSHLPVQFAGTFARVDGAMLSFPVDGMGHTCVMSFWSRETPDLATFFDEIKDLQARFPGQFEVFSFNVDELPDAGQSILRARGLDWTALQLPGGRASQVYRAYANADPVAIRVNSFGHAFISASQTRVIAEEAPMEQNFDELRYHVQLQALLVGEFLVHEAHPTGESIPAEVHDAIESCFVAPPLRYRITRSEALANYTRADELCRTAIAQHSDASDLWLVRNRRIIALLGRWNLATEPKYLEAAVQEARAALAGKLPSGAEVVPHFCLAKEALRRGDTNPRRLLATWVDDTWGDKAPASAYAAAAILAMDANAGELHDQFREKLLETHAGEPSLWPVIAFLLDQNHRYRLFKPNFYHPPSRARRIERARLRSNAAVFHWPPDLCGPLEAGFQSLSGETVTLPQATDGKLTFLLFVEPPAGSGTEFPTLINGAVSEDSRGNPVVTKGVMQHAFEFADLHVHEGIKVIAAFLSDDVDRVKVLIDTHQWPCEAVLVPGGLTSPLVRRLGVLSADCVPNIVLLRPDGSILWSLSGIVHPQVRSEGIGETLGVISRAMGDYVNAHEMEASLQAFEKGDFEEAVRLFSGPFPSPERPSLDDWTAPRLHGRALAHMQLKNWEAALPDLEAAIESHQWMLNSRKPCPCQQVKRLLLTKAEVLDQLGRSQEAQAAREQAEAARNSHGATRSGSLHDQLESMNRERGEGSS